MNSDGNCSPAPRVHRSRGQLIGSLVIALIVLGTLAGLITPAALSFVMKGSMADQLCSGRQIYLGLRNYASETAGAFPAIRGEGERARLCATSSEAFETLLPRYLDDKRPFFNQSSAWCYRRVGGSGFGHTIYPGENDWVYVRGLTDRSNSRYPLIANAFISETRAYGSDSSQPGGVWKGRHAIVIWAGGSGEIVETQPRNEPGGTVYFIPRHDRAAANAFDPDGEWLNGENVEVLYPELPKAGALPAEAELSADGGC